MSTRNTKKIDIEIRRIHGEIAGRIEERLADFRRIWESGDDSAFFIELVFCLLTPQSGSLRCGRAVDTLVETGLIFDGGFNDICKELNIVRFKNNKTRYILEARESFPGSGRSIREFLRACGDVPAMRKALVETVRGIGYKEASHYLRNIGLGEDLAILDRHILRNMGMLSLLNGAPRDVPVSAGQGPVRARAVSIPQSISGRRYVLLEGELRNYARRVRVPLSHLDFVFYYKETGVIFK